MPTIQVPDGFNRFRVLAAREKFDDFVEFVGVDQDGEPMRQHAMHRLIWSFEAWAAAQGLYAGIMCPAGHGKTTQLELFAADAIGRNSNVLCRFVTSSETKAKERAGAVRDFMATDEYRVVYPDVTMVKGEQGEAEFTVARTGVSKDPTLGCSGVMGGTGSRVNLLILDDVVDARNALEKPGERKKVYQAFRQTWMSRPNSLSKIATRVIWLQTAYHAEDAAALTMANADSGWAWLVVRAEEPFENLTYEIRAGGRVLKSGMLPNVFPRSELLRKAQTMGRIECARALGNRFMVDGEQPFSEELFCGDPILPVEQYGRKVAYFDSAGDVTKARRGDTDWAAFCCVGQRPDGKWDLVDSRRMRGTPKRQAEFCARACSEVGVTALHVEAVADGAMPALVDAELLAIEYGLVARRCQPRRNKEIRIQEALEPRLRTGMLNIHAESHRELVAEALLFPMGGHDDLCDAAAGAADQAMLGGPARSRTSAKKGGIKRDRGRLIRKRPRVWEKRRWG